MTTIIFSAALIVALAGSLVVNAAVLAELYELADFSWFGSRDQIQAALAFLTAVKAAAAAWLFRSRGTSWVSATSFATLAALATLLGMHILVAPSFLAAAEPGIAGALVSQFLGSAAAVAITMLLGVSYIAVGTAFLAIKDRTNGYRVPLAIGGLGAGISLLVVFIDTLVHVCVMFFDLTLLLFAISTLPAPGSRLVLSSPRWLKAYVLGLLALPLSVFVGHKLFIVGEMLAANLGLIASMIEEESTPMQEVAVWDVPKDHVPADAKEIHRGLMLNDAWFLSPRRAFAVERGGLHESQDGGQSWQRVRGLLVPGVRVRFSADGSRGWSGDPYAVVELTRDSGATWSRLDLEDLYRKHTGKTLGENLLGSQSPLYLDPESGHGSVILDCRLFSTEDFAGSWRMTAITYAENKRICLAETPLALADEGNLALGVILGSEILYAKDPDSGHWNKRCALDAGGMLLTAGRLCSDAEELSAEEAAFVGRRDRESEITGRLSPDDALVALILAGGPVPAPMRPPARPGQGDFRWLAAPGLLLTSTNAGKDWVVRQHVPRLTTVHPLGAQRAVGWNETLTPYFSADSGNVWLPLALPAGADVLDVNLNHSTQALWLLTDTALLRSDLPSGELRRVQHFDEGPGFSTLRTTHNGQRIWLFDTDHHSLQVSDDAGQSWHRIDLAPSLMGTASSDPAAIVDVLCDISPKRCLVVLSDGQVVPVTGDSASIEVAPAPVGTLPEDARDQPGFLLSHGPEPVLVFIPEEGRLAFTSSDGGSSWKSRSLRARQRWHRPKRSVDSASFIVAGEDGAVIIGEPPAPWTTVQPSQWEETMNYCWSASGQALYLYAGEQLAWTLDGGSQWRRVITEGVLPPFCGIGAGHLWLQLKGLRVYQSSLH